VSFWSDLLQVISSASGNEAGVTAPSSNVGPDLATKTPAGQFLTLTEGIWASVTDGKMWRSAGWLVLGVLLILLGAATWVAASKNPVSIARKAVT